MNGEPLRRTVKVTNPQGLHMRPMKAFVELANRFQSTVSVSKPQMPPVDGKSAWALLSLAAEEGTELTLEVSGPDETDALNALVELLQRPSFEEGLESSSAS
jgi:phosphocarrier protein